MSLFATCDGCGAADGVVYQYHDISATEHFCPKCAQRHALYTAAYDQLEFMVRNAVAAWEHVWGDLPGVIDLGEQLHQIGNKLLDERKAAQEGVQPAQPELVANAAD